MTIQRQLRALDESIAAEIIQGIETPAELEAVLGDFTPAEQTQLLYDWRIWARPAQLWPNDWKRGWAIITGRGWGKTTTAAQATRMAVEDFGYKYLFLCGPTARDTRRIMLTGKNGLLKICPPWFRPIWQKSDMRLVWPNGAVAELFTAERPDMFRGPEADFAWFEEIAAWPRLDDDEIDPWGTAQRAIRLPHPMGARWVAATTPRPRRAIRNLMRNPRVHVTRGSSMENLANLDDDFYAEVLEPMLGTTIGRQEIEGELLESFPEQIFDAFAETQDVIKESDLPNRFETIIAGLDWGGSNPTAFVLIGIYRGKFYVFYEYYEANKLSDEKYKAIKRACDIFKPVAIYCDPSAAQQRKDLQAEPYNLPVLSANNDVLDGITELQRLFERDEIKVVATCYNVIDELNNYSWKKDTRGNVLEKSPVKAFDHAIDAIRYAIKTFGPPNRNQTGARVSSFDNGEHIGHEA